MPKVEISVGPVQGVSFPQTCLAGVPTGPGRPRPVRYVWVLETRKRIFLYIAAIFSVFNTLYSCNYPIRSVIFLINLSWLGHSLLKSCRLSKQRSNNIEINSDNTVTSKAFLSKIYNNNTLLWEDCLIETYVRNSNPAIPSHINQVFNNLHSYMCTLRSFTDLPSNFERKKEEEEEIG